MSKLVTWLPLLAIPVLALGCGERTPSGLEEPPAGLQPSALAVPGASLLQLEVSSNAEYPSFPPPPPGTTVTDTDSDAQTGTLDPLSASASAEATYVRPDGLLARVLTTAQATATWYSADRGKVVFSNVGWETENVSQGFTSAGNGWTDSYWSYTFTADRTDVFTLEFEVTFDGGSDPFGLIEFHFYWYGGPGGDDKFKLGTSGTITRDVIAGGIYTVMIAPSASITGGLSTRTGTMTGMFDWRLGGINVEIDIKPGSDTNCLNNNGHGVIPVAILGSADFDVTQVDAATVALEGLDVAARGKADKLLAHIEDVNGDGFADLIVQIEDTDGGFANGNGIATLTGNLLPEFGGTPFEGTDNICVVP